jgi:divalent metal cation (Fe/Co/Zn/Cd) transporter
MVVHLLVPGDWTVKKGHSLAEQIETRVMEKISNSNIVTHVEPIGDPTSMNDARIDREL